MTRYKIWGSIVSGDATPWVLLSHTINTHPVSCADRLEVDTIALVGKQWCIPEAVVGSVVPHCERQRGRDTPRGEFCCEVVLRVE